MELIAELVERYADFDDMLNMRLVFKNLNIGYRIKDEIEVEYLDNEEDIEIHEENLYIIKDVCSKKIKITSKYIKCYLDFEIITIDNNS